MPYKPNLFKIATKELSQDGFVTWLLQWADNNLASFDENLNNTAKDFVRFLLGIESSYEIKKVNAGRQWHNIDIWAEVNDEYIIIIEDKINSCEHSEQLLRYKELIEEEYKDKNFKHAFVYFKTGNECLSTLNEVKAKGYSIVERKAILKILQSRPQTSDIFNNFQEYLTELDVQTNSYTNFENIRTNYKASEGFYMHLQEMLGDGNWRYVSNPKGGFLGFWYHWKWFGEGNLYIQVENAFENGIKLVVKIDEWEETTAVLYNVLNHLQTIAEKHSLSLIKPDKFRAGATSTVAIVENAFMQDDDGKLEFNHFINTLKMLEDVIDEYCEKNSPICELSNHEI